MNMMSTTTRRKRKVLRQPPSTVAELLPFDVITEILLRLPVKSLLRFKSVSKAWRQQITDPDFAKLHHSRSMESHSKLLLVLHQNLPGNSEFFSADLSKLDKVVVEIYSVRSIMRRHSCDICERHNYFRSNFVVGSSNGLICVFHGGKFTLWNPCTRTHRMIPCLDLPSSHMQFTVSIGFGYDPVSYDYKVLAISCHQSFRDECSETLQAVVYSLNSNSWREISYPQSMMLDNLRGVERLVFVNNAFHWLYKKVCDETIAITCFDIHDETYREMQLPLTCRGHDGGFLRLMSLEESLYAIKYKADFDEVDHIWVMNGYGAWSKSYVVMGGIPLDLFEDVVCRINEDEIFVKCPEGLARYDTRDRSMHKDVFPKLKISNSKLVEDVSPFFIKKQAMNPL
ncbi:hypothetical protein Dimus_012493 [Dionaea muscipula]